MRVNTGVRTGLAASKPKVSQTASVSNEDLADEYVRIKEELDHEKAVYERKIRALSQRFEELKNRLIEISENENLSFIGRLSFKKITTRSVDARRLYQFMVKLKMREEFFDLVKPQLSSVVSKFGDDVLTKNNLLEDELKQRTQIYVRR